MNNILTKIFGEGRTKYILAPIASLIIITVLVLAVKELKKPSLAEASSVTISMGELHEYLEKSEINPKARIAADPEYSLVSEKWIRDAATFNFTKFLDKLDMLEYNSNVNDCDDFARAFTLFSKFYFRKSLKNKNMNSCAVGEFYYLRTNGSYHAINFMIVLDENRNRKILFYEPQTGNFVNLTKDEIGSCVFYGL